MSNRNETESLSGESRKNHPVGQNAEQTEALVKASGELGSKVENDEKHAEELLRINRELAYQIAEKEKRASELEAAVAELESFTYSVSHDLRTPLRAINGFTRVLVEDFIEQMDEEARAILDEIIRSTDKMSLLIDNLLDFSRIGKQLPSMAEVDINQMVEEIIAELKQVSAYSETKIEMGPLGKVRGDRYMLKQVFTNLLDNAFKYTGKTREPRIEVGSYSEEGHQVYYVKDNGSGFDMRYYNKLFGVFQRLHSSNEFEGNGVGLAIVSKVVSKHKGRVWGEGKVNEGASFYVALPN